MMNKEVQDSLKQVGIRMVEEPPLLSPEPMDNPEAAVRVLGEWLSEMDRELFCVVNLNSHLTPINMNVVSMGTLNTVYVNPRETMKSAILSNAAYLMLVHNHPSGSLNPSREDITITDRIQNAASIMGIPVLDHIIVGRNQEFFSLRENNVFSYTNDIEYVSDLSKLQWTQQMSVAERSSYGNRGSEAKESKLDTIMKSLEEGVEKIFTSEQYHIYLDTMAKFHNYSFNNTLLIAMQRPDATLVAGYQTWQKKFQRHVKRGEKGIKIIAPAPVKEKREVEKVDDETQEIIIGVDGQPETEVVERILPRFRVTTVFDVSQTDGEPLPTLETRELDGDVIIYEDFIEGLEDLSPVPFQFIEIESGAKGYYSNSEKYIAIQSNMSQAQTMKTAVHETAHAILHDRDIMEENGMTKEEDQKICDLLRSRNKKGLDLLFQVYYTSLVLWANTFLNSLPAAEDLVQEFFITVWKDRFYEKFQAHHLSSFLRIVVKNRALNRLEKRDVLQSVTGLEHIELAWEEYNDRHDRIVSAVQKEILLLPPRSREIMLLVFQQGMKYQEVAKQLNISLSTVKNLVAKSVEKLRERLNDEALIYFFCIFPKRLKNK